jgi:hypothetical protein
LRVLMADLTPIDLKYYAVLDTTHLNSNLISNGQRTTFWFSQKIITAAANIVLYTRAGSPNEETRPDGSVYHFFFRGLNTPIYRNPNATAAIFEISDWATMPKT